MSLLPKSQHESAHSFIEIPEPVLGVVESGGGREDSKTPKANVIQSSKFSRRRTAEASQPLASTLSVNINMNPASTKGDPLFATVGGAVAIDRKSKGGGQ
jgi:hypothetical protein